MRRTLLLMWFTFSKLAVHAFIHSSHHCQRLFLIHRTTNQFPRRVAALDVSNRIWAMHIIGWNWFKGPKSWQGFKTHFQQQENDFLWWWRWSRWWCWCWGWRWLLGLKIKLLTKHFWRHVWLQTYVDQAKVLDLLETMSHGPIHAYHVYQKLYKWQDTIEGMFDSAQEDEHKF